MIAIMFNPLAQQLLVMAARRQKLAPGAYLFHRGDKVAMMHLVLEGRVELQRAQIDGRPIVLQRAGPGDIMAEASLHSDQYHCDAVAVMPSVIAAITTSSMERRLGEDAEFARQWSAHLAAEMQKARLRSEILSRKTVAERLNAWLELHEGRLPPRGEWKSLAAEIAVSPEALYREMSRRR